MNSNLKLTAAINSAQRITVAISAPILTVLIGACVLSPDENYGLHLYFGTYGIHWVALGLLISIFEFFWWKSPAGEIAVSKKVLFRSYYATGGFGILWILLVVTCPGYNTYRSDKAVEFKSICLGSLLILLPWIFHLWLERKSVAKWVIGFFKTPAQTGNSQQPSAQDSGKNKQPPPLPTTHISQKSSDTILDIEADNSQKGS